MAENVVRKNQAMRGLVFLAAAAMFGLLVLGLALQKPTQISVPEAIVVSLFLCPFFDVALYTIRKAKTQRAEWGTEPGTSEKVFVAIDTVFNIVAVVFVCLIGIGFGYFFLKDTKAVEFGASFFVQLAVYPVYFLFIRKVVLKATGKIGTWIQPNSSSYLPRYTLRDGGLSLDLAIHDLRDRNKKYLVDFSFDELDKLEVMEYLEAKEFISYQTGLGFGEKLKAGFSSLPEKFTFLQGKILKPKHYADLRSRTLPVLVMMGHDLFYVISVANPDNDDLVSAFQEYKKQHPAQTP